MATVSTIPITGQANVEDLYPNAASAGGDKFTPGADVILFFNNVSVSPITVTIATPEVVDGDLAVADRTIVVPASGYAVRAGFPARIFAGSDGLVAMTYSTEVDLTFGVGKVA